MHRRIVLASTTAASLCLVGIAAAGLASPAGAVRVVSAAPAAAGSGVAPPGTPECEGGGAIDFDGRAGTTDDAIGIPGEDVSGNVDQGMVEVRFGCGGTLIPQGITLPGGHAGDGFGTSLAVLDLNGDGIDDLVVGVPGYDAGSAVDAGAVAIYYGSAGGLTYSRTITKASAGVPGSALAGDHFGQVVASEVPYDGTTQRVRIGEPGHTIGTAVGAGGFVDLTYSTKGVLQSTGTEEVTLNSTGMPGPAAAGDAFGSSFTFYQGAKIGAPGRTVNGQKGAGAVVEATGTSTYQMVTQDTAGEPGTAEAGDHFGAALWGDWIGVPDEAIGSLAGAGMVERFAGSASTQNYAITQNSPGITGTAEAGDHFGASLAEFFSYADDTEYEPNELLVGVPGEDIGTVSNSGAVNAIAERFDEGDLTLGPDLGWQEGNFPGTNQGLGTSMSNDGGSMLVSAPGAYHGIGLVYRYVETRGLADQTPYLISTFQQVSGDLQAGDGYGVGLAGQTPQ